MVYYNKILRIWVIDTIDYFLISAIIASILTSKLKNYLSEEESMERLKNSIIKKSTKIQPKLTSFNSKKSKIKRIYKLALNNRGGEVNIEYELATKIKNIVVQLVTFLKRRELKGFLKIIFCQGRIVMDFILRLCNIQLNYYYSYMSEEITPKVIVIALTTGGTTGFIISWFKVGTILIAPSLLVSGLFFRSVAQQVKNYWEFLTLKKALNELLVNDPEIRQTFKTIVTKTQNKINNSNKILMESFENLNWNKNPLIKESCERLGIFDNAPQRIEKLNLDIFDPKINEFIEEFEFLEKKSITKIAKETVKKKSKGKIVYFQDFVNNIINNEGKILDSNIIDAEIIEQPIRIKLDVDK